MDAYVAFMRRLSAQMSPEPVYLAIDVGGPPPLDFVRALAGLHEVDFPERMAGEPIETIRVAGTRSESMLPLNSVKPTSYFLTFCML